VAHRVETKCRDLANLVPDIDRNALGLVCAECNLGLGDCFARGGLTDLIYHAAGGAAAEQGRSRAFKDFEALAVERIAE
jgi:hypothetical protein